MFSPKKLKISKKDLKKSIVKTNDRLQSINDRMESDIKVKKNELKSLLVDCTFHKEALEDLKGLQAYANNELEAQQFEISKAQNDAKKVLSRIDKLSEESDSLTKSNKKLESKEVRLIKSIALLEAKKEEFHNIDADLKDIKKEREEGQETLSLLGRELIDFEAKVESYASRKSAAKSDFQALQNEIDLYKKMAEKELKEIEDLGNKMKLTNGNEMARLDHSMADRMSELDDIDNLMKRKTYELSAVQFKLSKIEQKVNDVEEHIEISLKKEEDKVSKIKGDFKDWKIVALNEVAKMKLKGKMEAIDKAGLKDLLDG